MTIWLNRRIVVAIHEIQLTEHGGGLGLRDDGLLDSALPRPLNHAGYAEPDVATFGALYALGIIRNHPFFDGNERTGFAALFTFLSFNSMAFDPPEVETTMTILGLAAGEVSDEAFIALVQRSSYPKP